MQWCLTCISELDHNEQRTPGVLPSERSARKVKRVLLFELKPFSSDVLVMISTRPSPESQNKLSCIQILSSGIC